MKFRFDRNAKIKILLVLAVLLVTPYFAPLAVDFVILADFMGLEALLVFLFVSAKSGLLVARASFEEMKESVAATAQLLVQLPLFRPRVYFTHATASTLFAVLACSVVLACAVWVPVMMMSMRYIT